MTEGMRKMNWGRNWGKIGNRCDVSICHQKVGGSKALCARGAGTIDTLTVSPLSAFPLPILIEPAMSWVLLDNAVNSNSLTLCLWAAFWLRCVNHRQMKTMTRIISTAAPTYDIDGRWTLRKDDELSSKMSTFALSA